MNGPSSGATRSRAVFFRARTEIFAQLGRLAPCLVLGMLLAGSCRGDSLSAAPQTYLQMGLSLGIQRSDFDSGGGVTALYAIATLERLSPREEFGIAVPYLELRQSDAAGNEATANGWGDVRLFGRYRVLEQAGGWLGLNGVAELKLPTADEQLGLGTGEPDLTAGIQADVSLTDRAFLFGDLGYTLTGDPPGVSLQDQWSAALGGGFYARDNLALSASLEERRALVAGDANSVELLLGLTRFGEFDLRLTLNRGLSDTAPDYGITAGLFSRF